MHSPNWRARLVSAGAVGALATLLAAATGLAHGLLKSSSPASGAHLSVAPRELRLTFTEAAELAASRIELRGPDSALVLLGPLGTAPDSGTVLIAPITGRLVAGPHAVTWQVVGADGHPVRGRFVFVIAPGAAGLDADSASAGHDPVSMPMSAGSFDAGSPAYVAIRGLLYLGMLVMIGAVVFRFMVWRIAASPGADSGYLARSEANAARIGFGAAVLVLVACLARLGAQAIALHGDRAGDLTLIPAMIGATAWGRAWLLQLLATLVGLGAFFAVRRRTPSRAAWGIAAMAGVVLALTPALASHAAATQRLTSVAIAADALHVVAASGWLGTLLVIIAAGFPAAMTLPVESRHGAVARLIAAFSPTAVACAALLTATGIFAAWLHVGGFPQLWGTRYGKLLLAKVAALSIAAGTGAYNWRRVRPALGDAEGTVRIGRSARLELSAGLVVVIITAILVATPTPTDDAG